MNIIIPKEISYAPDAFRMLRGCFCIYKPSRKGFNKTLNGLKRKISDELNSMECRSPRERVEIIGDLSVTNDDNDNFNVKVYSNLADHPLVCGERYNPKQIAIMFANNPGWYSSGIMLGFIGSDAYKGKKFKHLPKFYEINGEFGLASLNYRDDGKVRIKSSYKHVNKVFFERIISKIEASQRSLMFKMLNINLQSEQAYEIAKSGNILFKTNQTKPLIVAIKPIKFELPNFQIQLQCYNENEEFLAELINEIGIALKTSARCTGIRLIQYGPFTIDNALLIKHWTIENLIENIYECEKILKNLEINQNNI